MAQQILSLLTVPPGNLAYHLVLAFSLASLLQACLLDPNQKSVSGSRRLLLGAGLLLGLQLVLFLSSAFTWQGLLDSHLLLPPLDRAVNLLSLIGIAWLWLFPQRHNLGDALALIASAIALAGMAYSYSLWINQGAGIAFNQTWLDFSWSLASGLVSLAGLVYLAVKKLPSWGFGFAILLLWLAGTALHWVFVQPQNDYSGIFRLAQLAAYPLLMALAYRYPTAHLQQPAEAPVRYGADPVTLRSFVELGIPSHKSLSSTSGAIAQAIRADFAGILSLSPDSKTLQLSHGFDRIQGKPISTVTLTAEQLPGLLRALQANQSVTFSQQDDLAFELDLLTRSSGLPPANSLLSAPLQTPLATPSALLLLSTHTTRAWTEADQEYLAPILPILSQVLPQPSEPAPFFPAVEQTQKEALSAWSMADVESIPPDLLASLPAGVPVPPEDQDVDQAKYDLVSLLNLQADLQQTIASLELENQRLKEAAHLGPAGPADQYLEKELQYSLAEVARLQNSLADANANILRLQEASATSQSAPARQTEVIASLVQEMRQPMASLAGYASLLMEETLGSLSIMQRKFMERIRASTSRLQCLVDDLTQITTLEAGTEALEPQETDLGYVLAQAVAFTGSQVNEKNLHLSVDVPDDLPHFNSDRNALEQVFIHLLQNAILATPPEGNLSLTARLDQQVEQASSLLVQVTDAGGGIHKEDLERVFTRFSRGVNIPIPGVGDNGVGLSIARTLVEALGGQIWVEIDPGKSSTFCVRLPLKTEPNSQFVDEGKA